MKIRFKFLGVFFLAALASFDLIAEEDPFLEERKLMIETQIRHRGIQDERVIQAMLKVERHRFIPKELWPLAYTDQPLPIGEGQTISQPYIVALMTGLLKLEGTERVLEIGTGSGYQAAILAELAREVYTIEIIPSLAERSSLLLKGLGYKNISVRCGDGYLGWPEYTDFDGIIVTCAPPEIPQRLIEQLADGGRMVLPVGRFFQELKVVEKLDGRVKITDVLPVRFVPMVKGE